jgi:DNA mismatch repair protein MSH3
VDSIDELVQCELNENRTILNLKMLLRQLPDLEKNLATVYYGRSSPSDVFATLKHLDKVSCSLAESAMDQFTSPLLKTIFKSLVAIREEVQEYLLMLNEDAAKRNDKCALFSDFDKFPEVGRLTTCLKDMEGEFADILKDIRKTLKKSDLKYTSVSGVDVIFY